MGSGLPDNPDDVSMEGLSAIAEQSMVQINMTNVECFDFIFVQ